jgi:hypothetical protein
MRVEVAPTSLKPGTIVVLRGSLLGLPLRWVAEHTEYSPPEMFADRQLTGPFDYWHHRHQFLASADGGTSLRDEIEYALPGGWLGGLLLDWMVRRKLEALFDFRHKVTQQMVQAG